MKGEAEDLTSINKIFVERDEARSLAEKWRYTAEANGVGEWEWFPWEPDYEQPEVKAEQ